MIVVLAFSFAGIVFMLVFLGALWRESHHSSPVQVVYLAHFERPQERTHKGKARVIEISSRPKTRSAVI